MKRARGVVALILAILLSGCTGGGGSTPGGTGLDTIAISKTATVTPANPTITVGATLQFHATVTLTNGQLEDGTAIVTWSSSSPAVATIAGGGIATGVSPGTTTITASIAGISANTVLTVTPATLQKITVTPAVDSTKVSGTPVQFAATGTFSDGSTHDVTQQATWTSQPISVATITVNGGLATPVSAGQATIRASISTSGTAITGQAMLNVGLSTGTRLYLLNSLAVTALGSQIATYALDDNGDPVTPGVNTLSGGTGGGSLALSPSGSTLYSANQLSNNLSTFTLTTSGDLSGSAVLTPTTGTPVVTATNANGTLLYVATSADGLRTFGLDTSGAITSEVTGSPVANPAGAPLGMVLNPNGKCIYTSNGVGPPNDVTTFQLGADGVPSGVTTVTPMAGDAAGVAIHPSGSRLYVANGPTGTLTVFTLDTNGNITGQPSGSPINIGTDPQRIAVSPGGGRLYVSDVVGKKLIVLTLASNGDVTGTATGSPFLTPSVPVIAPAPLAPILNPAGTRLYVGELLSSQFAVFTLDANGDISGSGTSVPLPSGASNAVFGGVVRP